MYGKSVGFVTSSTSPILTFSDSLLVDQLESEGFTIHIAAWDNPSIDWSIYNTLILRSCWNYHLHLNQFELWLRYINKLDISLWNPYAIVRWNIHKSYLLDLEQKGISIVPTSLIPKHTEHILKDTFQKTGYQNLVIKPAVGASAYNVICINHNDATTKQKEFDTLINQTDCLIQPLMKEITDGEISLVYFGKKYSHAILKTPSKNDFRVNHNGSARIYTPDDSVIQEGLRILDTISQPLLYTRIDGIIVHNKFVLMELELIEPHLFLDLYPKGAELFTQQYIKCIRD